MLYIVEHEKKVSEIRLAALGLERQGKTLGALEQYDVLRVNPPIHQGQTSRL